MVEGHLCCFEFGFFVLFFGLKFVYFFSRGVFFFKEFLPKLRHLSLERISGKFKMVYFLLMFVDNKIILSALDKCDLFF